MLNLNFFGSNQAPFEPFGKRFATCLSPSCADDNFRHDQIVFNQFIAASPHKQIHQIKGCTLVSIRETVGRNNAVKQCRRFLVDKPMIAMVGTGNCRQNCMLAHNPWSAAGLLKCFLMATNCVGPRDTIVPLSD